MWETSLALHDDIMKHVPPQAQEFYGQALAQARASVAHVSRYGASPEKVAKG